MLQRLFAFMQRMERNTLYRSMHGGLIMLIPVLLTGAFALAFQSLPIPAYTYFIKNFWGGAIYDFFDVVYSATFKMLSIYTTIFIGMSYGREKSTSKKANFGNITASVIAFFILSGSNAESFSFDAVGPKGMFIALCSSLTASAVYWKLKEHLKLKTRRYSDGTEAQFNGALSILPPLVITTVLFALFDAVVCDICEVPCIYQLFIREANALFALPMSELGRAFMYIFMSSSLWFFGIHGSDCLEGVAEQYFIPANAANVEAAAAGLEPANILTKGFIDMFVLMGGCGTAICLLAALLLFSKRRNNRLVTKMSAVPMIFNINEVMIFGLPVILNPIMVVPFLLVPLVSFVSSYFAMMTGLVPLVCADVEWTTPVIMGGYIATGSIAGTILQAFNLIVGTAIYAPFVRLLDRQQEYAAQDKYLELVHILQKNESKGKEVNLRSLEGYSGVLAKSLMVDITDVLERDRYEMYYQPQYDHENHCIGVEALFRWNHPAYGMVYPPLAVKLADESGHMLGFDISVFDRVIKEAGAVEAKFGKGIKISINVTGRTIMQDAYCEHIYKAYEEGRLKNINLCLEVTEQIAINFDANAAEIFSRIKRLGICFAIDDFSMGQTSIDYLKGDIFSIIKLDGSLTKGILDNPHCYEIISSISRLAESLGIKVLAEYVETEEQKECLHRAGCDLYQGYLYSPAISLYEKTDDLSV
ncbi:MAG: EAL domain-containing protein [Clostridia bacterium]|nr:EAL domain-containing protein [Clostridia bacterium]NCC44427.1 EAL domain-containing protein [Clostridia bacterium]